MLNNDTKPFNPSSLFTPSDAGQETRTYRDGTSVTSTYVNNKMNGLSTIIRPDGTIFEGLADANKDQGHLNGRGRAIYKNGKVVEAFFKNFGVDHLGISGSVQAGKLDTNGKLSGLGMKVKADKINQGFFINGKLFGLGKRTSNHTVYFGEFDNGKLHGRVKIKSCNFGKMTGRFLNNTFQGYGKIVSPKGVISEGSLRLHYPSRAVEYSDPEEQKKYVRELERGPICDDCSFCLSGEGKRTYQDGTVFEGFFSNDGFFIEGSITKNGELIGRVENGQFPPEFDKFPYLNY